MSHASQAVADQRYGERSLLERTRADGRRVLAICDATGNVDGAWLGFDPEGRLLASANYRQGYPHGTFRWWYPDGSPRMWRTMLDGLLEGVEIGWDEGGALASIRSFRRGLPSGEWVSYGTDLTDGTDMQGVAARIHEMVRAGTEPEIAVASACPIRLEPFHLQQAILGARRSAGLRDTDPVFRLDDVE